MERILVYVSIFSAILPFTIGLFYLKTHTRISNLILVLICFSLGSDLLSYISALFFQNNYWVIHSYQIIEIIILSLFYSRFLNHNIHLFIWTPVVLLYIFDATISNFEPFNTLIMSAICLFFILYGILGYFKIYNYETDVFIEKLPEFWFNSGIVCYFSGALFSWSMFHYLHQPDGSGAGIWAFHNIANILKNILFAIGLWKARAVV